MTSKTTNAIVAASLVLMALAPLGSAVVTDDTLSRTFPYISATQANFASPGIGWYDASTTPNICLIALLNIQSQATGVAYYETARVYTNLPGFTAAITVGPNLSIPAPCPPVLNPLCTAISGCGIHIKPITVGPNARTIVPQDGLVCDQASGFVTCVVTASEWLVSGCPWTLANFDGRAAGSNKGVFAGSGLENLLFSQDINCSAYTPAYDVSYLLDGSLVSSGLDGVTASLVIPYGNAADDTGFFVSCLQTTVTEIDTSTPIPTITPGIIEDGVDWSQILDLDAPAGPGWIGDLSTQIGAGNQGQLAAGLYDLGGDNDCDFTANTALPACHDGIDNDNDGLADESDPDCYTLGPNGIVYYNALHNSEGMPAEDALVIEGNCMAGGPFPGPSGAGPSGPEVSCSVPGVASVGEDDLCGQVSDSLLEQQCRETAAVAIFAADMAAYGVFWAAELTPMCHATGPEDYECSLDSGSGPAQGKVHIHCEKTERTNPDGSTTTTRDWTITWGAKAA